MASKKRGQEPGLNPEINPAINKEWLDGFAERKLPQVLKSLREKKPAAAADFVGLVRLDWQMNPVKAQPKAPEWLDWQDPDAEDARRT